VGDASFSNMSTNESGGLVGRVRADLDALLAVDVAELPDASVRSDLLDLFVAANQVHAAIAVRVASFDARGLADADACRTAAEWMAAHLTRISDQRAKIEAEIFRLSESADELATKTAAWGIERVDKAMAPLLARIDKLRVDLADLDAPDLAQVAAADAVAAWTDATDRGDVAAMRAMVKRTFPKLTVVPQTFYNDHGPHRLL
jgi:hypothetical protein